jgi:hypothetical protein
MPFLVRPGDSGAFQEVVVTSWSHRATGPAGE